MSLPRECISQARRLCSFLCCHAERKKWDMPEDVPTLENERAAARERGRLSDPQTGEAVVSLFVDCSMPVISYSTQAPF